MKFSIAAVTISVALLAACQQQADPAASPVDASNAAATEAGPTEITVPGGTYKLDPAHAILQWSVPHMGLSNYTAKFTRYDATITLDPQNVSGSKIVVTIDPTSVDTDFPGDYKKTHADTGFATWDEEIGKSERFLNGRKFPQITFTSTKVEPGAGATAKVTGDLQFLGVTKPVTMNVTLNGQVASHPMAKTPAIGFRAEGTFKRSDFGAPAGPMDDIRILFDGEFQKQTDIAG